MKVDALIESCRRLRSQLSEAIDLADGNQVAQEPLLFEIRATCRELDDAIWHELTRPLVAREGK